MNHRECPLEVDLTRSACRRGTIAICAQRTAGVDGEANIRIAAAPVAVDP
jgi:hypothetical protein